MSKDIKEIVDKLLTFSVEEQGLIADALLHNIQGPYTYTDEEYEEDLAIIKDAEQHPELLTSWEELRRKIEASERPNA